jgi:hypothetical protein
MIWLDVALSHVNCMWSVHRYLMVVYYICCARADNYLRQAGEHASITFLLVDLLSDIVSYILFLWGGLQFRTKRLVLAINDCSYSM